VTTTKAATPKNIFPERDTWIRCFWHPQRPELLGGWTETPTQKIVMATCPGVKCPGCEPGYSTLFSFEVNNECNHTSTSRIASWRQNELLYLNRLYFSFFHPTRKSLSKMNHYASARIVVMARKTIQTQRRTFQPKQTVPCFFFCLLKEFLSLRNILLSPWEGRSYRNCCCQCSTRRLLAWLIIEQGEARCVSEVSSCLTLRNLGGNTLPHRRIRPAVTFSKLTSYCTFD